MDALASRLSWRRLHWAVEVLSILAGYGIYAIVRVKAPHSVKVSYEHAADVIQLEQLLGFYHELALNEWITGKAWIEIPASYYYATLHFVVTPLVLVWLFRKQKHIYAPLRSAIVIATVAALVVYATWPLAPPRYATAGAVDTVFNNPVFWASGHGVSGLVNDLAAMPSLHVGWAVWVSVAVMCGVTSGWRWLAWLYPVGTTLVVVATANHYWLDAFAGTAVVALALQLCGVRPTGRVAETVIAVPAQQRAKATTAA